MLIMQSQAHVLTASWPKSARCHSSNSALVMMQQQKWKSTESNDSQLTNKATTSSPSMGHKSFGGSKQFILEVVDKYSRSVIPHAIQRSSLVTTQNGAERYILALVAQPRSVSMGNGQFRT